MGKETDSSLCSPSSVIFEPRPYFETTQVGLFSFDGTLFEHVYVVQLMKDMYCNYNKALLYKNAAILLERGQCTRLNRYYWFSPR